MLQIPILDLSPEIDFLWDELQGAINSVLRSGHFIMGPHVQAFESEVAQYLGVKHAIALNSGTDSLFIALKALGIGPGDEVITSPLTFFATAEAISHVGATPVFVDVDERTYNINTAAIEAAISDRTKAIIPVHLFGQAADMDRLMDVAARYGLKVVEDVAQAFGGRHAGRLLGTIGHVGTYSFFPTKNLGAYGDGGLLATNDEDVALLARKLRSHGSTRKYFNEMVGYNSRLDEIQASILRVKLKYVDNWNEGRRRVAASYIQSLRGVDNLVTPYEDSRAYHVYHQFTVRILDGQRDAVKDALASAGIATMIYYPVPVHQLPVYRASNLRFPVTERLAQEVLSLPMWPQMEPSVIETVVTKLRDAML